MLISMYKVSIHAPHEGERPIFLLRTQNALEFQSTLPTRGSDRVLFIILRCVSGFNPRSPRGGATRLLMLSKYAPNVSIHAPHEGERRC